MIIDSATRLAFAAGCLTAILTLPTAHAQMGGGPAPGSYWASPVPYGYGPPPSPYGYGPPQGTYPAPGAYGPPPGRPYGAQPGTYPPDPVCRAAVSGNPADNQRPADQPR